MEHEEEVERKYVIAYQLGARGGEHDEIEKAIKDLLSSRRAARAGGDQQGITIEVVEYRDGEYWGDGDLTEEEDAAIVNAEIEEGC